MVAGQQIPIFVVSLARAADRRAAMARRLGELGLGFEMTDAVDGKAMSVAEFEAGKAAGLSVSPGDMGCYLSHMNIYRMIRDRGHSVALVLEDDAALNPSIVPLLRHGLATTAFDICFADSWFVGIEGRIYFDPDDAMALGGGHFAYRLAPPPHGTHAYFITGTAATQRLSAPWPMTESIDWYRTMPAGTRYYGMINPRGAWLNETFSTVSFVSPFGRRNAQPWHMQWRRWAAWYDFWNRVHPSMVKARRDVAGLMASGRLPPGRDWQPLPPSVAGGGPVRAPRRREAAP